MTTGKTEDSNVRLIETSSNKSQSMKISIKSDQASITNKLFKVYK